MIRAPLPHEIARDEQHAALQAVLQSAALHRCPSLARLLTYLCNCYFEERFEDLKEYAIGLHVFERPESFDPAGDSIVRVEAHRLRRKLRDFYGGEGASEPIEIVVPIGQYRPEFRARAQAEEPQEPPPSQLVLEGEPAAEREVPTREPTPPPPTSPPPTRNMSVAKLGWLLAAILVIVVVSASSRSFWRRNSAPSSVGESPKQETTPEPVISRDPAVRIRCGYMKPSYQDSMGEVWMGDRYFSGGESADLPSQYIARTRDPRLYLSLRTGTFSYNIPAAPGSYELRLHFAETTYTPASPLGGGENSRVFDVRLNGTLLLTEFDIDADAGPSTADVRVFKGVHPDHTGFVRLSFSGRLGLPMINAIELIPESQNKPDAIRMVAQNSFYTDSSGQVWMPDDFALGGQLAQDKVTISGTRDPDLYAGERYGNFSYAIPVAAGRYAVTLYFSEKYWGTSLSGTTGPGHRVFDIFCNGIALVRNFDIAQQAGSARGYKVTYHDLVPNAQGKLVLSFIPVRNYAALDALEVEPERES